MVGPERFQIVFLDAGSVDLGDLDTRPLKKLGPYRAYGNSSPAQALKRAAKARIIIANKCNFKASDFNAFAGLKLVCVAATGVNNIDLEAARKKGVAVTNVPGYSTASVAEHAFLFLLAFSHRLLEHNRGAKKGAWSRSAHFALLDYPFSELKDKTLGIVGYGRIGREVSRLAKAFGMKIRVAALPGRSYSDSLHEPFRSVLAKSDFVTLHCPLTDSTRHLFNARTLSRMKKGSVLLNLARGPIVEELAVAQALASGQLTGYATDVLSEEPPKASHPLLKKSLKDRVLLTPHIAWAGQEARQRLIDEIAGNIRAFLGGRRRNRVV